VTELPTGTVTFLFTDIEGSTRLLEQLGTERYAHALAAHRRVIREACAANGGVEVDTAGDAFFVAFPTAQGALAAAAAFWEGLAASGPVWVRVGVHTGTPLIVEDKYVGMDVHRAARIAAAGHGGQVLVSAATAALTGTHGLRDLGEHRFKDLAAPERVYQLGQGDFPALKSLYQTNLPVPATPFLGRERELRQVVELVRHARVVTLTGPGGTGKTRLAVQVAAELADDHPDGVFWVPLAALRDPDLVLESAAQALGARDGLASHIGSKRVLLLFDNFEQVADAASGLAEVLSTCPNLKLLATSREPLHLLGEQEYPVPPLGHEEAVAFFVARARTVKPDFEPDSAVPEICRRLDELPLALELAAARVKALSPQQILERLEQRLPLLTGGARDLPERQRTLKATIAWSHDLLSEEEQRLFARLAVFAGGCTLEAAEEVAGADLDTLQSLVDKSLLRFSNERYWMLETIGEYAAERLVEAGTLDSLRSRHADYFFSFVGDAFQTQVSISEEIARLAAEQTNVRAALVRADEQADMARVASAVWHLWRLWLSRGQLQEGLHWAETALAGREELDSETLVLLLAGGSELFRFAGDTARAKALKHECLDVDRRSGLRVEFTYGGTVAAHVLADLADIIVGEGQLEQARRYLEESLALGGEARALGSLGDISLLSGDVDQARRCYEQALVGFKAVGHDYNSACMLNLLGEVARRSGERVTALAYFREALGGFEALGDEVGMAACLDDLAAVAADEGELVRAGRLVGAASALRASRADQYESIHSHPDLRTSSSTLPDLPKDAVDTGRLLTIDEVVRYALGEDA
jgi:predicted ATPase